MSKLTFSLFCRFVTLGDSPYERDTFRYSPVLAFTCVLNVTSHPLVGKAFFVVGDLVSWVLIKKVLSQQGGGSRKTKSLSAAYLFNPYTITMSTRGSCESFTAFLLMLIVCCLQCEDTFRAASCFAFATLFRLYPIIYSVPLLLYIDKQGSIFVHEVDQKVPARTHDLTTAAVVGHQTSCASTGTSLLKGMFSPRKVYFCTVAASLSIACVAYYQLWYGMDFFRETFVHHMKRVDIRHNFSMSFYSAYLATEGNSIFMAENFQSRYTCLIPHITVILVIGIKYASDLPFCLFMQTFAFVTLNSVCTAQYFVWYLCLFPLCVPNINILRCLGEWNSANRSTVNSKDVPNRIAQSRRRKRRIDSPIFTCTCIVSWFTTQIGWLVTAYSLEFTGVCNFWPLWALSTLFLSVNTWSIVLMTSMHTPATMRRCFTSPNDVTAAELVR